MYDACVCTLDQITPLDKWRCSTKCLMTQSVFVTVQQKVKVLRSCGSPLTKITIHLFLVDHRIRRQHWIITWDVHRVSGLWLKCNLYVSSFPLSQLWTESFDPCSWIIALFWLAGESSTGDVPISLVRVDGHLLGPPLPPLGHNPIVVPPQQPLIPGQPGSDHFSVDDQSVHTPFTFGVWSSFCGWCVCYSFVQKIFETFTFSKTISIQMMHQL